MNIPAHVSPERVYEYDIYGDSKMTDNLQESYTQLHDDAPAIFYTPCNGGHWVFTRFDDIFDVVRDPKSFSAREMQIPRVPNPPLFIPLSLDPPEHIPYRKALMRSFTPQALEKLQQRIREFAVEMIEDIASNGQCEFVHDISSRFPVSVFMELMGMPLEKLREFREVAEAYFKARTPEEVGGVSAQIIGIMTELVELRRVTPGTDIISDMLSYDLGGGRQPSLEEIQSMCLILFLGGMDTVTNVTSYLYRHLGANPELQKRLLDDAEAIPKFIEEGLRCFGVVNTPRIVKEDCHRFGIDFKEGDMVLCMLPAGSRDSGHHDSPNTFDIERKNFEHLTFSQGPHLCLGRNLARMEMRILTEEWIKRIPAFRLKPGVKYQNRAGTVLALASLPLEWDC